MVGASGSGKTYQALKLMDQYMKVSKQDYSFDEPFQVKYTPFTHMFYISGTVKEDRTLKTDKNMSKYILIDSDKI